MFNYPAVIDGGPYFQFNGHSSFVKNVCWLADDARVVSAGGADRAMLQWVVKYKTDRGAPSRRHPCCQAAAMLPSVAPPAARPPCARARAATRLTRAPPWCRPRCPSRSARDAGHVGYRAPGAKHEPTEAPPPPPPSKQAAPGQLAADDGKAAAAAEEQRRQQAKQVAALEQQMQAIEAQQASLRAELSRLKK
jgi:hypothetical protein